ncbi:31219_t:CDS:2 [Gigaspora margarita]|uniref:31219_t:CDS:1 n=1 Tax=Gigaspora margarita TaxID=4874 RepID=A0ABN7V592_GIGMA|nr:31219_t:CDS:2 [Gigaspora margarita]
MVNYESNSNYNEHETHNAQTIAAINEIIPQYITQLIRKNVIDKINILNMLYCDLMGNTSTFNDISKDMQECLKLMLELEDPNIIVDLRTNNRFKGSKFDIFWSELQAYFNEFIFVCDIQETIIFRLKLQYNNPLPETICIPSIEWIQLQFWPKTPQQIMQCNIQVPDNISDSFYSSDVYVGYKNTIFESSNAIQHATEFFQTISLKFSNKIPPILCLYTDSGPDHRTNFGSVQISLISLFFKGDFDIIIAMRTAPYHSWANPTERIMSILNLATENNNLLRKELKDSIMNIQNLLNERTTRLEMENIDDTLQINETTWAELQKHKKLMDFLNSHCQQRLYSFQIKKCMQYDYSFCKPIRMPLEELNSLNFLPDPIPSIDDSNHYSSFNSLYGNETNENHCPSLLLNQEGQERGPNNLYTHKNINGWVEYEDHSLYNTLFVCEHISCNSPIETNYYSCKKGDQIQLCCWCGAMDGLLKLQTALTNRFKKVYPCCMICKESGKDHFTQIEIKTSKSKKKTTM